MGGHVPRPVLISGAQFHLRAGKLEAFVASVGASLRVLRDADGDLVVPFDPEEIRPAMCGTILAPWPNRTAGGRYTFDGAEHQLPVNELPWTTQRMGWQRGSTSGQ